MVYKELKAEALNMVVLTRILLVGILFVTCARASAFDYEACIRLPLSAAGQPVSETQRIVAALSNKKLTDDEQAQLMRLLLLDIHLQTYESILPVLRHSIAQGRFINKDTENFLKSRYSDQAKAYIKFLNFYQWSLGQISVFLEKDESRADLWSLRDQLARRVERQSVCAD